MKYRTLVPLIYRSQNKRGGRPIIIDIPSGSVGMNINGCLTFHSLARSGHNPFVFLTDVFDKVAEAK